MITRLQPGNLRKNSFLYEACARWVASLEGDPLSQLGAASDTALLAWKHHCGRFADGALENCALRVGHDPLPPPGDLARWDAPRPSTTLHVVSLAYPVGGHTRMVAKWALHDGLANHVVVLTQQSAAIPPFFERAIAQAGGTIVTLPPSDPPTVRAATLRKLSDRCDRVILYTHPNDVVPIIAFARAGGPPVAMFNHAHFGFSFGPSVADIVVNTFDYFRRLSERFRFARRTACLSVVSGFAPLREEPVDKEAAKKNLGLDPSSVIALTVAHDEYFTPTPGYDFFQTGRRLLHENPAMHMVMMGVSPTSPVAPADVRNQPRWHLLGPVTDPIPYYQAADLCLESFPMPSLGVMAEAVAQGEAFPIPVYGPSESILRISQAPLMSYPYRPRDEDDYVSYVGQVLSRLKEAREEARQMRAALRGVDEAWGTRLQELSRELDQLAHVAQDLPRAPMIDSEDSRALANLQPLNLSLTIDRTLPFGRALRTHVIGAYRGYLPPAKPLAYVGRRAANAVRHLHTGRSF